MTGGQNGPLKIRDPKALEPSLAYCLGLGLQGCHKGEDGWLEFSFCAFRGKLRIRFMNTGDRLKA